MQPDALGILEDILEAITHIEADTAGLDYESFSQEQMVQAGGKQDAHGTLPCS
jgi:uncharacterized protein with HEPN domain